MRKLFLILLLVGCDCEPHDPYPVQQAVAQVHFQAPKVHSIATQQAYNCERICATAHMEVLRFSPGAVGKSTCVCGSVAAPAEDNTPGIGTGIAIGVGAEVGRHVGRAVLDELF